MCQARRTTHEGKTDLHKINQSAHFSHKNTISSSSSSTPAQAQCAHKRHFGHCTQPPLDSEYK